MMLGQLDNHMQKIKLDPTPHHAQRCITALSPTLSPAFLLSAHWKLLEKTLQVCAHTPCICGIQGSYILMLAHTQALEIRFFF